MKLDYARNIAHIPLTSSVSTSKGLLTAVRGKHYYIQYDNLFYTVPKHLYLLVQGKRVVTNSYENTKYRLICYNNVDEFAPSIYNALVTAFVNGALPSKSYERAFPLILEGCLNVNAIMYGTDKEKFVLDPLMEVTDLEGFGKNEEWLKEVINGTIR